MTKVNQIEGQYFVRRQKETKAICILHVLVLAETS